MSHHAPEKLAAEVCTRRGLLEAISETQPVPATELERAVDSSVSTINRVVSQFERENLLERTDDGIVMTRAGTVLFSETERFIETVDTASDLQPLLSALSDAPVDFDTDWIFESTVTRATPNDPYAPLSRYSELFVGADEKRLVGDRFVVPQQGVEAAMREIGESVHCTCVWSPDAVDRMAEQFPDMMEWSAKRENLTARVAETVSLDLALFDDRLLAYGFDQTGIISILVDTDTTAAVEWGDAVFETLFEEGEMVPI
ncbi:helix-turn-helix transcriptional regulator [Halovivax gelatinilyticus]|uniref:helix-turn-helix transcriptional regulator n=1 Tax=Halovivax gelatinilyticus TaxID=2961597 RepID=UPI0020CA8E68|nr:hypothetical protein [Halovivax gelatinilyticus]